MTNVIGQFQIEAKFTTKEHCYEISSEFFQLEYDDSQSPLEQFPWGEIAMEFVTEELKQEPGFKEGDSLLGDLEFTLNHKEDADFTLDL